MLITKYQDCGIIICGDKNNTSINPILALNRNVKKIVTKNTHGTKILDVIITNHHLFYHTPIIILPVPADIPDKGSPNDHFAPLAVPIKNNDEIIRRD